MQNDHQPQIEQAQAGPAGQVPAAGHAAANGPAEQPEAVAGQPAGAAAASQQPHVDVPAAAAAVHQEQHQQQDRQQEQQQLVDAPDEHQRSSKRQRTAAWFSFEPEELCDMRIVCGDGKVIEVHKAVILRHSAVMKRLLEDLQGEQDITVSEHGTELMTRFLNLLYDPSTEIKNEHVMDVLSLADKYDSPAVLRACRRVLSRPDFQLTCHQADSIRKCDAVTALSLASKHGFTELYQRCLDYLAQQHKANPTALRAALARGEHSLQQLSTAELAQLVVRLAGAAAEEQQERNASLQVLKGSMERLKETVGAAAKNKDRLSQAYKKLLAKHNRLLARAQAAGVQP